MKFRWPDIVIVLILIVAAIVFFTDAAPLKIVP